MRSARRIGPALLLHRPVNYAVGIGRTIKIQPIVVHYDFAAPAEHREAVGRTLRVHTEGCPAHQSVKDAIAVSWDARAHLGDEVVELRHAAD